MELQHALEVIAPVVVAVVFILTVGGVVLLRPLAKHAGELLEAMAKERNGPKPAPRARAEDTRLVELLEAMSARMERLEERQDFTDSLLGSGRQEKRIPAARDTTV